MHLALGRNVHCKPDLGHSRGLVQREDYRRNGIVPYNWQAKLASRRVETALPDPPHVCDSDRIRQSGPLERAPGFVGVGSANNLPSSCHRNVVAIRL